MMDFFVPLFVGASCLLFLCILDTQKEVTKDILERNKNILNNNINGNDKNVGSKGDDKNEIHN